MTHDELYESKSQMKRVEILKAGEKQMTHDELLAEVDTALGLYITKENKLRQEVIDSLNALRAVVELPIEDNSKPDSFNMNFANRSPNEIAAQCFQWGYATAMNKVIKTIEKELQ